MQIRDDADSTNACSHPPRRKMRSVARMLARTLTCGRHNRRPSGRLDLTKGTSAGQAPAVRQAHKYSQFNGHLGRLKAPSANRGVQATS